MAPARFGTDGVRGVANEELTPELALALGRAAARVLPAPTFVVGRDTRRSGPLLQAAFSAGLAAEGADVVDLGVLPDARRGRGGRAPRRARRRDLGLAQPLRRQRDQALQPRSGRSCPSSSRREIERELDCDPGRSRSGRPAARPATAWAGSAPTPARSSSTGRISYGHARGAAPRRAARRRRLRQRRRQRHRAAGAGRRSGPTVDRAARRARRRQHQRQVRFDRSEPSWRAPSSRRGPTSAWPSTATPTGSSPSTTTAPSSTATSCWPSSPSTWPSAGQPGRQHGRGDGHDQPRLPPGHGGPRHRGARDRRGGPPRAGRARRRRARASAASSRATSSSATRSTTGDGILTGIALADLVLRVGTLAGRARRPGWSSGCPSASSTCRSPSPSAWPTAPRSGRRWPRPRPSSGTTAGCCCAPSGTEPLVRVMVEARVEAQANAVAAAARRRRRGRPRGRLEPQAPR